MFGAIALGGQWILTTMNRYRQDKILTATEVGSLSASSPISAASPSSSSSSSSKDMIGTGLLNVLPVHRTDVDDYEARLKQKLELIEREQAILKEEKLRRKRLAVETAVEEKAV